MLVCISIMLVVLPENVISEMLVGQNQFIGMLLATVIGSVTLMPGFVAFPLASILLERRYDVVAPSGLAGGEDIDAG